MSDTDAPKGKAKTSWTDKERLTYLFALIDNSNIKFDYAKTPRPQNRSVIACQRMIERLRGTLKSELEALQGGQMARQTTVSKRNLAGKRKVGGDEEGNGRVKKRGGRGKKGGVMDLGVGVMRDDDDDDDEGDEMGEAKVKVKKEVGDEELASEV